MKNFKKIAGINFIILVIYALIIPFIAGEVSGNKYFMFSFVIVLAGLQVITNLLAGIILLIMKKKGQGLSFLVTSGLLLLIVFSSCLGAAILFSTNFAQITTLSFQ